jgi:glycerophosphoryl diester phosphodiesterase
VDALAGMENSLSAMSRARKEGFRYLEIDVHATSDGVVVVQHDPTLDRTTDAGGAVAEKPWSIVSKALIGGREPVCRLDAVLEELPDALLNIDVKADSAAEPVLATLRRTDAYDRVCLASFSEARLARLRRAGGPRLLTSMGPGGVLALLGASVAPVVPLDRVMFGWAAQVPVKQGPITVVSRRSVTAAHRLGREVHVWTVNEPGQMRALLDLGVDGLVTDRPDLLRTVLRERDAWSADS